jgi:type II secretory pathway pseudopilin PulG
MLVVAAIIGIITAISFPSASAGIDSVRLVSATDSVAAFINSAVNRVERRQQPIELEISLRENRLSLYSTEAGFTRELKMEDGIAIEAVLPTVGPTVGDDGGGVRRFILMPGATVPGIGIRIANRRGARRVVRLDPMTGFPRVESVNPQ